MRPLLTLLTLLSLFLPSLALAQDAATFDVRVSVTRGAAGEGIAGAPVLLRAMRRMGPNETKEPAPQREWAAVTDASGVATFAQIPESLTTSGLQLHAVTQRDGVSFKSRRVIPTPGLSLDIPVFPKTFDPSVLVAQQIRTVIEPWEGYLIFSQEWTLGVKGDAAFDTSLVADPAFERGLPIELPVKAQGINVQSSSGQTKVVNSTIFYQGIIAPGQPLRIQFRYSMAAKSERFTYTQRLDYPTQRYDVLVPVHTDYEKIRYLPDLELRSFDLKPGQRADIPGLRTDREFIIAMGQNISPKNAISFQLRGLPFQRPDAPLLVVVLGLLGAVAIIAFASASRAKNASADSQARLVSDLRDELRATLDTLVALEDDLDAGHVSARDYEFESTTLRARAALLIKKLEELGEPAPGAA